ncbi:YiiX/YebB-like N1pC/P60 family cysteine hydrolase [Hylemonella gracilis]|uniref:YiiX/YebB-like N1pC/P60 family cysteine hydrolase n=1 Tax=Hylemonella gracilis TaxID=80880 RepID=UPI0009DDF83A|nr:YiiX/YebB-like N1pC/P60 family cysteine hydrolase [Hylemonella gracilis]
MDFKKLAKKSIRHFEMQSYFLLDTKILRPGDIVLTKQVGGISKKIRVATGSTYSHAILFVATDSYIHSDRTGVHSGNPQRLLFTNNDHATILRLKPISTAASVLESACSYARSQIGKQYSVPEAVKSKWYRSSDKEAKVDRQFCSRLVAQAFSHAGVDLVSNTDYCYPDDFLRSRVLFTVKASIRSATRNEVSFAKSPSPLEKQAQVTNRILEQARKLTGLDIQTLNDIDAYIEKQPIHDDAISKIFRDSGYLELWKTDLAKNPWRYNTDQFLALNESIEAKNELARREFESASNLLRSRKEMLFAYQFRLKETPLLYFQIMVNLYEKLVDLEQRRITVARNFLQTLAP